jgi:hypothetical protein
VKSWTKKLWRKDEIEMPIPPETIGRESFAAAVTFDAVIIHRTGVV